MSEGLSQPEGGGCCVVLAYRLFAALNTLSPADTLNSCPCSVSTARAVSLHYLMSLPCSPHMCFLCQDGCRWWPRPLLCDGYRKSVRSSPTLHTQRCMPAHFIVRSCAFATYTLRSVERPAAIGKATTKISRARTKIREKIFGHLRSTATTQICSARVRRSLQSPRRPITWQTTQCIRRDWIIQKQFDRALRPAFSFFSLCLTSFRLSVYFYNCIHLVLSRRLPLEAGTARPRCSNLEPCTS